MNSSIPEYTVYIPKGEPVNKANIDNIGQFTVDIESITGICPERIPRFNS
jgi:hypothetical protein